MKQSTTSSAWLLRAPYRCVQDRLFGVPIGAPSQLRTASAPAGKGAAVQGAAVSAEDGGTTTSEDGDEKTVSTCGFRAGRSPLRSTVAAHVTYAAAANATTTAPRCVLRRLQCLAFVYGWCM